MNRLRQHFVKTAFTVSVLLFAVNSGAQIEPITVVPDADALEADRLRELLLDYQAAEAANLASEARAGSVAPGQKIALGGTPYDRDKVLLSGTEAITAIQAMNDRLERGLSTGSRRRETDIIYHIEVRRDGSLISSGSHSLKTLGGSQFMGNLKLQGGQASVTVKTDNWTAELSREQASEYIITLNAPYLQKPELHIIPVDDLRETNRTDLPAWLPYKPETSATPEAPNSGDS